MENPKPVLVEKPAEKNSEIYEKESVRLKSLWEDALLLRYYLSRKIGFSEVVTPADEELCDKTMTDTVILIEKIERQSAVTIQEITEISHQLAKIVDTLIRVARGSSDKESAGETVLTVTPQSLRASLPEADICIALGNSLPANEEKTDSLAKAFILRVVVITVLLFFSALSFHLMAMEGHIQMAFNKDFLIPVSSFLWSLVGSMIWILVRFRTFGAAYAFDPAYADTYWARIFSGAIISSIIMYFVFGGKHPWVKEWASNLPLWGFVMGYSGKLQVDFLQQLVNQIESTLDNIFAARAPQSARKDNRTAVVDAVPKPTPIKPGVEPDSDGSQKPPAA